MAILSQGAELGGDATRSRGSPRFDGAGLRRPAESEMHVAWMPAWGRIARSAAERRRPAPSKRGLPRDGENAITMTVYGLLAPVRLAPVKPKDPDEEGVVGVLREPAMRDAASPPRVEQCLEDAITGRLILLAKV